MSYLEIENIQKQYGTEKVLHDLSLALSEHESLSVLGKSGCGKTTMLQIIAGLVPPDNGVVKLKDKVITEDDRDKGKKQIDDITRKNVDKIDGIIKIKSDEIMFE